MVAKRDMLQIHLLMTLLVLLLTPLSMVISRFIAKRSYHLFQKQTETRGIQTQLIEESLSQQTIIQSFNAQEEFIQRLHDANDNYAGYSQSAIFIHQRLILRLALSMRSFMPFWLE